MRVLTINKLKTLTQTGFSAHLLLPVVAIIGVAAIGTILLHASHAATATPYYTGTCTKTTYNKVTTTANTCVADSQAIMDSLQHQESATGHSYRTAVSAGSGVFKYGTEYYLLMNGVYNTATQTALHRLGAGSGLTGGTASTVGWQMLCTDAAHYGLNSNGSKLVFSSSVKGEFSTSSNATIFAAACGSSTGGTTGSGSTSSGGSSSTGGSNGTTATGFITTSGTKLMLAGKQYRSLSFDFSPLGACWNTNWTTAQMDTFFAALPSGSLARFFAPPDNTDSASFVESIVHEADKYNIHLIIALADADVDNNCDTENASNNGKTAAYYTDAPVSGSTWYNWVQSVVKPLANDSGVAIWEISNEPLHAGVNLYDGQVSQATFDTYVKNSAAVIKAAEVSGAGSAKQLISIAPADMGDVGNASGAKGVFTYLDVVDDHDYSADADTGSPAVNNDFAQEKQVAQALGKPFMVDEAGVEAGSSCKSSTVYNAWDNGSNGLSLSGRVTFLVNEKASNYLSSAGGASALDIWLYTGQGGGCSYENISTSDPIMAAVKTYKMPN
jgi:hypothetical protein